MNTDESENDIIKSKKHGELVDFKSQNESGKTVDEEDRTPDNVSFGSNSSFNEHLYMASDEESPNCSRRDFQIPFLRDVYSFLVDSVESGSSGCQVTADPVTGEKTYTVDVSLDLDDEKANEHPIQSKENASSSSTSVEGTAELPFPVEVETILSLPSTEEKNIKIKMDHLSFGPGRIEAFYSHPVPLQHPLTAGTRYYATNISTVKQALATMQCLIRSFTSHRGAERVTYKINDNLITKKKTLLYEIEEVLYHSSEEESSDPSVQSSSWLQESTVSDRDEDPEVVNYRGTNLPVFSCVICHAVGLVIDEVITISTMVDRDGNKIASCIIERSVCSIAEGLEQSLKFNTVIAQQSAKMRNNQPTFDEFSKILLRPGFQIPFYSSVLAYLSKSIRNGLAIHAEVRNPFTQELITVYAIQKSIPTSDARRFSDILKSEEFFTRLHEMKNFRAAYKNKLDRRDDLEGESITLSCSFLSCFRSFFH
ncbi:unnamed protein product [Auanema sp. JU1783]|nr:unnamed protein product [Auanema sp. JU1783]